MTAITNKELIQKATSVIKPRTVASGKLSADVGAALVTDKNNWNTEIILEKNKVVLLKDLLPYHWHNPQSK